MISRLGRSVTHGWCLRAHRDLLIKAAIDYNANKAVGLTARWRRSWIARTGTPARVIAAGSFALYSLSDARYRRI